MSDYLAFDQIGTIPEINRGMHRKGNLNIIRLGGQVDLNLLWFLVLDLEKQIRLLSPRLVTGDPELVLKLRPLLAHPPGKERVRVQLLPLLAHDGDIPRDSL